MAPRGGRAEGASPMRRRNPSGGGDGGGGGGATLPPPSRHGGKVYYAIDPTNPPSIPDVAAAWRHGVLAGDVSGVQAYYPLLTILRDVPGSDRFERLVTQIARNGITEPVMLEIARSTGEVRVGEGNHRLAALLTLFPPGQRSGVMVPVRFYFKREPGSHGTQTWATFRDPDRYYRAPEPKKKGRGTRRKERRVEARNRQRETQRETQRPAAAPVPMTAADEAMMDDILKMMGL